MEGDLLHHPMRMSQMKLEIPAPVTLDGLNSLMEPSEGRQANGPPGPLRAQVETIMEEALDHPMDQAHQEVHHLLAPALLKDLPPTDHLEDLEAILVMLVQAKLDLLTAKTETQLSMLLLALVITEEL